jgi:hypothetical protein
MSTGLPREVSRAGRGATARQTTGGSDSDHGTRAPYGPATPRRGVAHARGARRRTRRHNAPHSNGRLIGPRAGLLTSPSSPHRDDRDIRPAGDPATSEPLAETKPGVPRDFGLTAAGVGRSRADRDCFRHLNATERTIRMATIQHSDGAGASLCFATHPAVSPRAAGRLHRPGDARAETGRGLTSYAALLLLWGV